MLNEAQSQQLAELRELAAKAKNAFFSYSMSWGKIPMNTPSLAYHEALERDALPLLEALSQRNVELEEEVAKLDSICQSNSAYVRSVAEDLKKVAALSVENERLEKALIAAQQLSAGRLEWITALEAELKTFISSSAALGRDSLPCSRCQRPVMFEFTVESETWNRIVRSREIGEYLCFWCFDELAAGEDRDKRIPVGVNIGGRVAFSSWCGSDVPGAYVGQINEYLTDPLALAVLFHVIYERLAPNSGYETRKETRIFDPESANGKLMIATCAEIQKAIREDANEPEDSKETTE